MARLVAHRVVVPVVQGCSELVDCTQLCFNSGDIGLNHWTKVLLCGNQVFTTMTTKRDWKLNLCSYILTKCRYLHLRNIYNTCEYYLKYDATNLYKKLSTSVNSKVKILSLSKAHFLDELSLEMIWLVQSRGRFSEKRINELQNCSKKLHRSCQNHRSEVNTCNRADTKSTPC